MSNVFNPDSREIHFVKGHRVVLPGSLFQDQPSPMVACLRAKVWAVDSGYMAACEKLVLPKSYHHHCASVA